MSALTNNSHRLERGGALIVLTVAAAAIIHQGALLQIDSDGKVKPATATAGEKYIGIAGHGQAASASGKKRTIEVRRNRLFSFSTSGAAADVGDDVYAADDNTLTVTAAGHSKVGTVVTKDDNGVWVYIGD